MYRLEFHLIGWLLRVGLLVLMWYALYNIFGATLVSPGGYIWDPLVTFIVSATVGGVVCRITQLPPLLGVLWVAIMWNNIPKYQFLTHGVVREVRTITQRTGLTLILARAGFSMSFAAIRPHLLHTILLSTIPYQYISSTFNPASTSVLYPSSLFSNVEIASFICSLTFDNSIYFF